LAPALRRPFRTSAETGDMPGLRSFGLLAPLLSARVSSGAVAGELGAAAPAADDWAPFPSAHGLLWVHRGCIHQAGEHFHVGPARLEGALASPTVTLASSGEQLAHPPCPHAARWENATSSPGHPAYYSDWAAYAQATHAPDGFGYMSSDWEVPAAPKSSGPVPGMSSAYVFNGLEDGSGKHGAASFILQPVLSYGKSGCVLDPLNFFSWHFTSFYVTQAGRAYCGRRLQVEEGEVLRGVMRLQGTTWTVESVRLKNNETSSYSVDLGGKVADAAYLTLESMINYGCNNFPASGSVTFSSNVLKDVHGNTVTPSWTRMLRHTECNERVEVSDGGSVTLSWDTSASLVV